MGTWGTGIGSNDTYADVYGEFFDLYDDGLDVAAISSKLIRNNRETVNDSDDANNFWFALAKCQWEVKSLEPQLFERICTIVESGADLEIWRRLDATEGNIRKREKVINDFLEKLRSEKPKARRRRKKIIRQPVFEKGDCLTFRLENGNYGGAVVLESTPCTGFGLNLIAATRINQPALPTTEDFAEAEVLVINYSTWRDESSIGWNYNLDFNKDQSLFEVVGRLDVGQSFDPVDTRQTRFGYRGGWKVWIIDVTDNQFASEKIKLRPKKKVLVKDFMKNEEAHPVR
ncbi:MAG: hypothetical protein WBO10_09570 [Pyrinomonadaceae bacterium]